MYASKFRPHLEISVGRYLSAQSGVKIHTHGEHESACVGYVEKGSGCDALCDPRQETKTIGNVYQCACIRVFPYRLHSLDAETRLNGCNLVLSLDGTWLEAGRYFSVMWQP